MRPIRPNGFTIPRPMHFTSTSPEQTKQIAADFAKTLKGGEVIFLHGDLGAGKTTFVQGFVEALGYEGSVRSPTFSIMNNYLLNHPSIHHVVHFDFYRLETPDATQALGLEEFLQKTDSVMLIEWPTKGLFPIPLKKLDVTFTINSGNQRHIEIQ